MLSLWANWLVTKFGLNSLMRYLWPVLYVYCVFSQNLISTSNQGINKVKLKNILHFFQVIQAPLAWRLMPRPHLSGGFRGERNRRPPPP